MIEGMPRKFPLYVNRQRTRHGKILFYFRRSRGPRIPLPHPTADDFHEKYLAALAASGPAPRRVLGEGSLAWLIARYRETSTYRSLSDATRKQRDNIFKGVAAKAGQHPYRNITRKVIVQAREDRASTPAQARNFLDAMRGLFRWAIEAELVTEDPTANVSNPRRPKGAGFAAWTEADVAAYEARWPEGTKERVWLHVLLYTGLRRGDAVMLGRQHIRHGIATMRTEKTGMEVDIRIAAKLEATLRLGPTGDLAFIIGDGGRPLTKESFGNMFRAACNEAGVRKSAHGLRKLAATAAAEAGCTVGELEARFGWTGGTMASHYTRTADRKRMAASAEEKIGNADRPNLKGNRPTHKQTQ